jgi:hypothetical protein
MRSGLARSRWHRVRLPRVASSALSREARRVHRTPLRCPLSVPLLGRDKRGSGNIEAQRYSLSLASLIACFASTRAPPARPLGFSERVLCSIDCWTPGRAGHLQPTISYQTLKSQCFSIACSSFVDIEIPYRFEFRDSSVPSDLAWAGSYQSVAAGLNNGHATPLSFPPMSFTACGEAAAGTELFLLTSAMAIPNHCDRRQVGPKRRRTSETLKVDSGTEDRAHTPPTVSFQKFRSAVGS